MALRFQPLDDCVAPAYPTKLAAVVDPQLLLRRLPRSWLGRRELALAAGVLLGTSTAVADQPQEPAGPATDTPVAGAASQPTRKPRPAPKPALAPPIFRHGEGRASAGCIAVNPPSYLSEEAALQIICEELQQYGVEFASSNVDLPGTRVRQVKEVRRKDEAGKDVLVQRDPEGPLNVDRLDPTHHVAVEFASAEDFWDLDGPWRDRINGTAFTVETQSVAEYMRERVDGSTANVYFGAFYDPLVRPERPQYRPGARITEQMEENRQRAAEESKRLLREQVKDFVAWLKAQGVI